MFFKAAQCITALTCGPDFSPCRAFKTAAKSSPKGFQNVVGSLRILKLFN
jgi:hypothetical protein